MKTCIKCLQLLELSDFNRDASKSDGLRNECKPCRRAYKAEWRQRRPDLVVAYKDAWRVKRGKRPSHEARFEREGLRLQRMQAIVDVRMEREKSRIAFVTSPSKACACCEKSLPKTEFFRSRSSRDGHDYWCKDCRYAARAKRTPSEKAKTASYVRSIRNRSRQYGVEERITAADVERIYAAYAHRCFACSSTDDLTLDHHRPVQEGYALLPCNAVVLCRSCNSKKNVVTIESFYSHQQIVSLISHLATLRVPVGGP